MLSFNLKLLLQFEQITLINTSIFYLFLIFNLLLMMYIFIKKNNALIFIFYKKKKGYFIINLKIHLKILYSNLIIYFSKSIHKFKIYIIK